MSGHDGVIWRESHFPQCEHHTLLCRGACHHPLLEMAGVGGVLKGQSFGNMVRPLGVPWPWALPLGWGSQERCFCILLTDVAILFLFLNLCAPVPASWELLDHPH